MADKELSEKKLSKKQPSKAASDNSTKEKSVASNSTPSKTVSEKPEKNPSNSASKKSIVSDPKSKQGNKTAVIALSFASVSIIFSIGHFFWQQQNNAQLATIKQQSQQMLQQEQAQLKVALTTEFQQQLVQQKNSSQTKEAAQQAHFDRDAQIEQLTAQIKRLEQQVSLRHPSDWLIHEAEYLIRVAARTMWLARDTKAAIGLLRDADNRLKELNLPKFLPVRALINEDIETLALMPTLQNQEAILTLMALNKQVNSLEHGGVQLAEVLDGKNEDTALSEDVSDWQDNLAKTWHKFLNNFITVRRRNSAVEPLLPPEQLQHLKQNLSLKLQLVKWAASEQKVDVYQQGLLDIQLWLNEFFDMNLLVNQKFYQAIEQLKKQTIHYDYPSDLRSLTEIKRILSDIDQGYQKQEKRAPVTGAENSATLDAKQAASAEGEPLKAKPEAQEIKEDQANGGQL